MATYSLFQSVMLMELAAAGAADVIDTQPNLLKYLQVYLNGGTNPGGYQYSGFFPLMNPQLIGGDWSVVWGPCLYLGTDDITATNAMFVAYSPSQNTYLVSVAATNPLSFFDWFGEDFDIIPASMTAWPPKLPFNPVTHIPPIPTTTPAISAGTATGISDLLTQPEMVDPQKGNLRTFLNSVVNSSATLIFGGHSLAGALAPTLAFYLYPKPASSGWKQVLVMVTAGATPGNQAYASAFNQAYPPIQDQASGFYWNTDYANSYDIVPHAWDMLGVIVGSKDSASNYPSIWGVLQGDSYESVGFLVKATVVSGEFLAANYYTAITRQWVLPDWGYWAWNGNSYPPVWTPAPVYTDSNPLSTMSELGSMLALTHGDQYYNVFDTVPAPQMQIPPLLSKSARIRNGTRYAA